MSNAPEIPVYKCLRTSSSIQIDGRLDEADWQHAPIAVINECTFGEKLPPELYTEARLLWDDENLYVAFDVSDPDICATKTERDDCIFDEDVVELFVSMRGIPEVKEHFAEFEISPTGVMMDLYNVAPYKSIINWDAKGWRCVTRVDGKPNDPTVPDRGYTVEMAIPFINFYAQPFLPNRAKELGNDEFAPKPGEQWRMNLFRIDYCSDQEAVTYCSWSPTIERKFHVPDRFGIVSFVE